MSTFFGGPQLASVTSVHGNIVLGWNTTTTIYTVPAGFNAAIKGVLYGYVNSGAADTFPVKVNNASVLKISENIGNISLDIFLSSGSTITAHGAGDFGTGYYLGYYLGIQLYKNP